MKKGFIFFYKTVRFFYYNLFRNPKYAFTYLVQFFNKNFKLSPQYLSENDVIKKITIDRKSFIRLGDGELALIAMRNVPHQKADAALKNGLLTLIKNYTTKNSVPNYILGIPQRYIGLTNTELRQKNMLGIWLPFKIYFKSIFDANMSYADSHAFYVANFFEKNLSPYLKNKKLIIVTTKNNIEKQKQAVEANFSVLSWLEARSPNPYDGYAEYKTNIYKAIEHEDKNNIVVIASCGPASKPLAYELSTNNIQCLDIGTGFEHLYKQKALDHILV